MYRNPIDFYLFIFSFYILQLITWCKRLCPEVWWTCWLDGRVWQT